MKYIARCTALIIAAISVFSSAQTSADQCGNLPCGFAQLNGSQSGPQVFAAPSGGLVLFNKYSVAGDYIASGIGVRGDGGGMISVQGIPSGATILAAFLYWETLGDGQNGSFNARAVAAVALGTTASPCWPEPTITVYRADVLGLLDPGGNGIYPVRFPDAGDLVTAPSTEGASLVIVYMKNGLPNKTILLYDGAITIPFNGRGDGSSFVTTITGFSPASNAPKARITYVVGDGQSFGNELFFNGTSLGSGILSSSSGPLWDNLTFDVSNLISPGTTQVTTFSPFILDCVTFGALVFAIEDAGSAPPPTQVLIVPGILGTKLSATSNVPWLTNSQLTSAFVNDVTGNTPGIIQLFSQLEYTDDGTPTTNLNTADLLNYVESPLPASDLNCQSPPQFLRLDCGAVVNTYNSLRDFLLANGFVPQSFAYDWRMDLTVLSTQLYKRVSQITEQNPGAQVSLIAHSMGGLIVGKMLTRIASGELAPLQAQLGPVITLGAPFDGAVDAYLKLRGWQGLLPWVINGQASVAIGKNWTSAYELLPRSDFVSVDLVSLPFASVYDGTSFASDLFPALPRQNALSIADSFWNTDFVEQPSVFRIVGTGQHTAQTIAGHENTVMNSGSTPALCKLEVIRGDGDGTVLIGSATNQRFLPTSNNFYVQDTHIHLPSNPSVLSAIGNILAGRAVTLPTTPTGIQPEWRLLACSPVTMQVTDAAGNVTDLHTQQIPDSAAFPLGEATQVSVPGTDQFQVVLIGTAVGSFDLIFNKTDSTGQILQQSAFLIVPVLNGSQAHVTLGESGPGLLTLDLQGNGVTEFSIFPGKQPNTMTSLLVLNAVIQSLSLPHGIEVSLTTKLKNAVADLDHGENQSALGVLNAFTNELSAQSGKALLPDDAASLVRIVNRLMSSIVHQAGDVLPKN